MKTDEWDGAYVCGCKCGGMRVSFVLFECILYFSFKFLVVLLDFVDLLLVAFSFLLQLLVLLLFGVLDIIGEFQHRSL